MHISIIIKRIKKLPLLVILFIFVGSILRGWNFWTHNFNGDEALNVRKAVSIARGLVDFVRFRGIDLAVKNIYLTILQHNHPPLELFLLITSVPFENREFFARLIFILINILFLIFSYFFSLRVINKKYAFYAISLLSTSSYFIWTSRILTQDSLDIIASYLIGLSIIHFYKSNNPNKAIIPLLISTTIGLYTFINFFFYLPFIGLLIYFKYKKLKKCIPRRFILIFVIINCLFYLPYIGYSFFPTSPPNAGFNYYLHSKLQVKSINLINNLTIFYNYFFLKSGVFLIALYALIGMFQFKKNLYIRYFTYIISVFLIINLVKITTFNFYMSFYGLLVIIAALWLVSLKNLGKLLFLLAIIVNLYGCLAIIKGDYTKASAPIIPSSDNLKKVGQIAKLCLKDNESYISTSSPWRTFYYFGRPVLPIVEGSTALYTPSEAAKRYLDGDLRNEVFLIHYQKGEFSPLLSESLRKIAKKEYVIDKDIILLFKPCSYRI